MKRFAGSVGTGDIYDYVNDQYVLAAHADTFTDSTITISTTQDEIKGGLFAPTQFTFTHDASIKVALTDIVWNKDYIAMQLGANFDDTDQSAYFSETVTAAGTSLHLTHLPVAMDFGCGSDISLVSYRKVGSSGAWTTLETTSQTVTNSAIVSGAQYCVRYAYSNPAAVKATITAHIVPKEVRLIIRAPLFAGDSCEASLAEDAGEVQYIIPRFKFDGNVTLSMAMSSNQTIALNGTALASNTGCDMKGGKLMDIVEITPSTSWADNGVQLILGEDANVGEAIDLYLVRADGSTHKLSYSDFVNDGTKTYYAIATPAANISATAANFTWVSTGAVSINIANMASVPALAVTVAA